MALVQERVGIKVKGQSVQVPRDPQSRLMYYCDCIHSILPGLNIPLRLRQFRTVTLDRAEENALLQISELIGPDTLGNKVIFRSDDLDSGNKFVELQVARTMIAAVQSIVIGGQENRVAEIMLYTGQWMNHFYTSARREIRQQRMAAAARVTPRYTSTTSSSSCVLL